MAFGLHWMNIGSSSFSVIATLLIATGGHAYGRSQPTAEQAIVHVLSRSVGFFVRNNTGQWPTNWNQLEEYLNTDDLNKSLLKQGEKPIQATYTFVRANLPFRFHSIEGNIIMIRVAPLNEEDFLREHRYVVYADSTGDISYCPLEEDQIQALLTKARINVPQSDPAVVHAAEEAAKAALAEEDQRLSEAHRIARFVWVKEKVKGLFVRTYGKNSSGRSTVQPGEGSLKPLPIALAVVVLLSGAFLTCRLWTKRRQATGAE